MIGGFFIAKSSFSAQEKYELIMDYRNRSISTIDFCNHRKINQHTIKHWIYLFETYGMKGLQGADGWKRYSKELKTSAVLDFLAGKYSSRDVIRKYEISSRSVLARWVKIYNGHRELEETKKRMSISMTKGRSTTFEERLEIVMYCIQHERNYHETAHYFDVSYQQVYQWTKKYDKDGEVGLQDKRGKRKEDSELTSEEKIQREIKRLERENERLRAENAFLKKLEEIERRRF